MSQQQARTMADRYVNAAKDGYLDVLQQATKRDLNTPDEDGMTAVMWAAYSGHLDALRLIVGRGGDVDRCDYLGLTPLHHSAQRGHLHVVTYLVNWGANIYMLDNDHHSAMDLASLYERQDVVQYLDVVSGQQQAKNPKHVQRLKDEAVRQAERNVRRYHKLQEGAARRAQKEQRRLSAHFLSHEATKNGGPQSSGQGGKNFIKSLTMAIRGSKINGKAGSGAGKSYSDIAGLSHSTGARGGVAKRISQRRAEEMNGEGADFKISDTDESGKRTLRSLPDGQGVRGASAEVMYMPGQRGETAAMADGSSRPAVYDVFRDREDADLAEDEESMPGIFNRPGFGKTAFLTGSSFLNTLHSFDDKADGAEGAARSSVNGFPPQINGQGGASEATRHDEGGSAWEGPRELPWDQEEVDNLDDDDEGTTASALETFLWSAGLETYLHKFLQEKVDMALLLNMSDADLKEIGLPFGPRKKLLEAIKRRQDILAVPKDMADSFL